MIRKPNKYKPVYIVGTGALRYSCRCQVYLVVEYVGHCRNGCVDKPFIIVIIIVYDEKRF